jgi:hypothetical protein
MLANRKIAPITFSRDLEVPNVMGISVPGMFENFVDA